MNKLLEGQLERRFCTHPNGLELRQSAGTDGRRTAVLTGYAAVFGSPYRMSDDTTEVIAPGAFAHVLKEGPDVRALLNHDPNYMLGRTSNGTLRLREDTTGLHMVLTLPDTAAGRDVGELVRRRDLVGQSFSFTCAEDRWERQPAGGYLRTVCRVGALFDVGPVCFPAYVTTSVTIAQQADRHAVPRDARLARLDQTCPGNANLLRRILVEQAMTS